MASLFDREHKRRSKAWDHFVKKDTQNHLAECKHCKEIFSYSSTSANLLRHLQRRHNLENNENSLQKEKQLESEYWEYFNRNENEDKKKAFCKLCSVEVDYEESSTAPLDHLKSKHIDQINEVEMVLEEDASDDSGDNGENEIEEPRETPKRSKTSVAWKYFDIEDHANRMACCKLCGESRSYRSTVTNLIRHLSRKHRNFNKSEIEIKRECDGNETTAETDAEDNTETFASDDTKSTRKNKSLMWLYFRIVDKRARKAQCLVCKRTISYCTTVTNLKKHLERKHPHLKLPSGDNDTKTILLSANGDLYEVETDKNGDLHEDVDDQHEPEEMDTVYLEDFDALENTAKREHKHRNPRKREIKKKPLLSTINLHDSSSDDELPLRNRTSDSIDHFGRYAASLLRELPKEIANKLQSDFIARIMDAQLTYETQKLAHAQVPVQGQNNAYSITVTTVDNDNIEIQSEEKLVTEVFQSET